MMPLAIGIGIGIPFAQKTGVAFSPARVNGMTLWLKPPIVGLVDGDHVATWLDSSGNANDATQPTAILQPAYSTDGLIEAYLDTNQRMLTPSVFSSLSFSIIILANMARIFPLNPDYKSMVSFNGVGGTDGGGFFFPNNGANKSALYLKQGGGFDSYDGTGALTYTTTDTFSVFEIISNGTTLSVYNNGILDKTISIGPSFDLTGELAILGFYAPSATRGFDGALSQVCVYDNAVSAPDMAAIQAYLLAHAPAP